MHRAAGRPNSFTHLNSQHLGLFHHAHIVVQLCTSYNSYIQMLFNACIQMTWDRSRGRYRKARHKYRYIYLSIELLFILLLYVRIASEQGASTSGVNQGGGGTVAPTSMTDISSKFVKVSSQKKPERFVLTFVGDTMLWNVVYNWERTYDPNRALGAAFDDIRHLLEPSDFIIMNLEGPISTLPLNTHALRRSYSASFGMDPKVANVLKDLGVGAANGANNHAGDRGVQGMIDTRKHLHDVGIPYFGNGLSKEEQADPLIIQMPNGKTISISSFLERDMLSDIVLDEQQNQVHATLRPEPDDIDLAVKALKRRGGADVKIAFPHWIANYLGHVPNMTVDGAHALADNGLFDLIVGSAGSHTVHRFDFVGGDEKIPCLYDIGNFVFMNPEKRIKRQGGELSYFGSVTHLIFDAQGPKEFEIHCTQNNHKKVHFKPRPCLPEEADQLFATLGPYMDHKPGDIFAKVHLRQN